MKTEEQARELIEKFGIMQTAARVFDSPCPRCGENRMNPIAVRNSLSRYAKVYICDQCGMDEAVRDMAGQPLPLSQWNAVRALSNFGYVSLV